MYWIGKPGQMYGMKLNANCSKEEKNGEGPGSCGGKSGNDKSIDSDIEPDYSGFEAAKSRLGQIGVSVFLSSNLSGAPNSNVMDLAINHIERLSQNTPVVNSVKFGMKFLDKNRLAQYEPRIREISFRDDIDSAEIQKLRESDDKTWKEFAANQGKQSTSERVKTFYNDLSKSGFKVESSVDGIIVHELGHALTDDKTMQKIVADKVTSAEMFEWTKISGMAFLKVHKEPKEGIGELLAESVVALVFDKPVKNYIPSVIRKELETRIYAKNSVKTNNQNKSVSSIKFNSSYLLKPIIKKIKAEKSNGHVSKESALELKSTMKQIKGTQKLNMAFPGFTTSKDLDLQLESILKSIEPDVMKAIKKLNLNKNIKQ